MPMPPFSPSSARTAKDAVPPATGLAGSGIPARDSGAPPCAGDSDAPVTASSPDSAREPLSMGEETICAISTAPGPGGIAIVRGSGTDARRILEAAFLPARREELLPRRMSYGRAVDGEGNELDEVLAVWLPGPHSYTREDMFEIHCHGGNICAQRVLTRCLALGARPAQPGEFTRRAFLHGRIDLSRAEAVMQLIGANAEAAARASLRQLEGGVSSFVTSLCERLKKCMALIEACTDFPDEVGEEDTAQQLCRELDELQAELARHCNPAAARVLREGFRIVLAGRPNVGKSSLMNALLRRDRAIVTGIPGTTRDVLTERLRLGGVCAELSDTAGLHDTRDPIEREGVSRTQRAMEDADLILLVLDASAPLTAEDEALLRRRDERTLVCLNKCDLPRHSTVPAAFELSALTGEGLPDLLRELERRACAAAGSEEGMTQQRHLQLASRALASMKAARQALAEGVPTDLAEIDLRDALDALSEITGENATESLLDAVFQNFCVGK